MSYVMNKCEQMKTNEKSELESKIEESVEEKNEQCLHQVFRPEKSYMPLKDGYGDCSACEYDPENNKNCKGYKPIAVYFFNVKEEGS